MSASAIAAAIAPPHRPAAGLLVLRWLAPVSVASAIFAASSLSPGEIPSGFLAVPDKLGHFVEYLLLAASLVPAVGGTWPERSLIFKVTLSVVAAFVFGISDELHQAQVPGRDPSGLDLIADAAGSLSGGLLCAAIVRLGRK